MEDLLLVAIGAFLAAALTVPAGFGLSTMLTPMVLLLMGPHEAVAVVAIVHGAHNAGKFAALKEHVDFSAFRKYGVWLVVGAILARYCKIKFHKHLFWPSSESSSSCCHCSP